MADSGALRARRHRQHVAGDHSLCRHGRAARPGKPLAVAVPLDGAEGGGLDPQESLRALARRLEAAHEADPSDAALARELRITLQAVAAEPEGPADPLEELRALADAVP